MNMPDAPTMTVSPARQRGAGAILAMMFLVIFASLATAMAIVSQGNLRTADSHLKMNRALAAAETGMRFMIYRMHQVIAHEDDLIVPQGIIDKELAVTLWKVTRDELYNDLQTDAQDARPGLIAGGPVEALEVGPIAVGPNEPAFTAVFMQHPIPTNLSADHPFHGHSYDSKFYKRPPYDGSQPDTGIATPISAANTLDARWVRLRVEATDRGVTRSISLDLRIDKKIRAAILSKNRVMIGRNVMVEGRIGSNFMDVHLPHGHPVQMESDFRGLTPEFDAELTAFVGALAGDPAQNIPSADIDGDNRLNTAELAAVEGELAVTDVNGDGFVDAYDLFLARFQNAEGSVLLTDLESGGVSPTRAKELLQLIDTFGDPSRPGYGDGKIDERDRYAKIRGEVVIAATRKAWEEGAAKQPYGTYQDYFQGPIHPGHHEVAMEFGADADRFPQFTQEDFSGAVQKLEEVVGGDVYTQADDNEGFEGVPSRRELDEPEAVPFGAENPYDYYDRPVFENMVFKNVRIPKGTNALFINCRFIGVTYVEIDRFNSRDQFPHFTDPDRNAFNYGGMQDRNGDPLYPELDKTLSHNPKTLGNNLRFHNCRFEGSIVSGDQGGGQPLNYSHTRNKLNFTGNTEFPDLLDPTTAPDLTDQERQELRRSRILTPHMSVEMGTFDDPTDDETIHLTGAIVAGVIDLRGNIKIDGTLMTTYEPKAGDGTVMGDTSPNFNTTLGYFSSEAGDLEAGESLGEGMGAIQIRYDPTLPLPDGVLAKISIEPMAITYHEGGAQ